MQHIIDCFKKLVETKWQRQFLQHVLSSFTVVTLPGLIWSCVISFVEVRLLLLSAMTSFALNAGLTIVTSWSFSLNKTCCCC